MFFKLISPIQNLNLLYQSAKCDVPKCSFTVWTDMLYIKNFAGTFTCSNQMKYTLLAGLDITFFAHLPLWLVVFQSYLTLIDHIFHKDKLPYRYFCHFKTHRLIILFYIAKYT